VTASSESSSSSYSSVRALDEFGNSKQLQYAQEAATRHGRLVVAGQSSSSSSTTVVVSIGQRPIVQRLTLPTKYGNEGDNENDIEDDCVAMCCTGIKGDATWLTQQMRIYSKNVWERYDTNLSAMTAAQVIGRFMGRFQKYNEEEEWQPSVARQKGEWSRPMGIQVLVLSTNYPILRVDPSGRVVNTRLSSASPSGAAPSFVAMGKDCKLVQEKLVSMMMTEKEEQNLDATKLEERLVQLLLDHAAPRNQIVPVMVETVSSQGVHQKLLQFRNGKPIVSAS
jgi:20S proteasome alpha/beta subunit